MTKRLFWIGVTVGIFVSGVIAAVVGVANPITKAVNLGGFLIVVLGFISLIYGLTRKS